MVPEVTCHARSPVCKCHADMMKWFLLSATEKREKKKNDMNLRKNNCRGALWVGLWRRQKTWDQSFRFNGGHLNVWLIICHFQYRHYLYFIVSVASSRFSLHQTLDSFCIKTKIALKICSWPKGDDFIPRSAEARLSPRLFIILGDRMAERAVLKTHSCVVSTVYIISLSNEMMGTEAVVVIYYQAR